MYGALPAFLSTLSLRRATGKPRALKSRLCVFLSTLSLRRATLHGRNRHNVNGISIHALLAESDEPAPGRNNKNNVFLSTLSLRRATKTPCVKLSIEVFLSTLSLRRATIAAYPVFPMRVFLSTLSLRRATVKYCLHAAHLLIFLSTLSLRRATIAMVGLLMCNLYFYPRSPCGERRKPKALKSRR